jgi:hypothetical protein
LYNSLALADQATLNLATVSEYFVSNSNLNLGHKQIENDKLYKCSNLLVDQAVFHYLTFSEKGGEVGWGQVVHNLWVEPKTHSDFWSYSWFVGEFVLSLL